MRPLACVTADSGRFYFRFSVNGSVTQSVREATVRAD